MSDLLSLLSLGSGAISAQNNGIAVSANNVANANTAGFSRQRADFESLPGMPLVGGVLSGSPERAQDLLLAGRIRTSSGALSMSRAFASAVLDVEGRVAGAGPSIHEQLGGLFSRISQVSARPTDRTSRDAVVAAARDLVEGIRRRAEELDAAQQEANHRVRENTVSATELALRLAETNKQIARTNDPVMRDERDRIANQLHGLVGGRARIDSDGNMRFVLDGGAVLVDGNHASQMVANTDPVTGNATVEVVQGNNRRDVTAQIAGGAIGADIAVRDGTIARAKTDLHQLASDIATGFNATHAAHAGLDGTSGRPMFSVGASATAASTIEVDAALLADSSLLATGAAGSGSGDNTGALALFSLATAPAASGGRTFTTAALDMVSTVAGQAANAKADVHRDELIATHLDGLRDSLAGVDIQEEMTNLARFEHASTAMARFISTIDGLLGHLIDRM